jgi:hypothetical protein
MSAISFYFFLSNRDSFLHFVALWLSVWSTLYSVGQGGASGWLREAETPLPCALTFVGPTLSLHLIFFPFCCSYVEFGEGETWMDVTGLLYVTQGSMSTLSLRSCNKEVELWVRLGPVTLVQVLGLPWSMGARSHQACLLCLLEHAQCPRS